MRNRIRNIWGIDYVIAELRFVEHCKRLSEYAERLRSEMRFKSKDDYWTAIEIRTIYGIPQQLKEVCDGGIGRKTVSHN